MAYKTGADRQQIQLFPTSLDSIIGEDNPVRVIDAFVEWLDLAALGFTHTTDNTKGTSVYHPGTLLKLYLYGYLNRIRSSRRLARECERNIELLWLLKRLTPEYHTISDFRKDNKVALRGVFKEFTQFCIAMSLIEGKTAAFDGTKIHAQNNQKNNFNLGRLEKLLTRIDNKTQAYEEYLTALDEQDKKDDACSSPVVVPVGKTKADIEKTLTLLKERRIEYEGYQKQLKDAKEQGCETEDLQISTVDPDARAMVFKKNHTEVGYNIQSVGDAKHSLIVHFDVTNVNDTNALADLAIATKEILHKKEEQSYNALADAGYHTGSELAKCADNNITTYVCTTDTFTYQPKSKTNLETQTTPFTKDQFLFDDQEDAYTCPNNQKLKSNGSWYEEKRKASRRKTAQYKIYTLPSKTCQECPFSEKCQGNLKKQWHCRSIKRYSFDEAVQANRKRLALNPNAYKQRKEIIEHPFGSIKRSWGYNYTLLKTKSKVTAEFSLIFLAYNFRRVLSILGVEGFTKALKSVNPASKTLFITFFNQFQAYFFPIVILFNFCPLSPKSKHQTLSLFCKTFSNFSTPFFLFCTV